jgi:formylglycine-generating enzyme required for sulfatase activity
VEQAARAALQTKPAEASQPNVKIEIPVKPAEPIPSVEKPVEPQAGTTRVREKDGAVMVYVPAGEFLMGSGDYEGDASKNEKPRHKVYLDDYWIDRTPVTNAMYHKAVEAGACTKPHDTKHYDDPKYADHPVVFIDWQQAQAYCRWVGGRLPSEAQWEKAARGTDGRIYPWGNQSPDKSLSNYGRIVGDTMPVGSYPKGASPYGVLDMAGNVWEWVNDWYAENYYKVSPVRNPAGPEKGDRRVLRGGAFDLNRVSSRCAYRVRINPLGRYDYDGFRLAVVL